MPQTFVTAVFKIELCICNNSHHSQSFASGEAKIGISVHQIPLTLHFYDGGSVQSLRKLLTTTPDMSRIHTFLSIPIQLQILLPEVY